MTSRVIRLNIAGSEAKWENVGIKFPPSKVRDLNGVDVALVECDLGPNVGLEIAGLNSESVVARGVTACNELTHGVRCNDGIGITTIDHIMVRARNAEEFLRHFSKVSGAPIVEDVNGERSVWISGIRFDSIPTLDLDVDAEVWGIAFRVQNLTHAASFLGSDLLGEVKSARQEGDLVAVIRSSAGLGVPVALVGHKIY